MFNEKIQVEYIYKAGKPGRSGYERAMEKMGRGLCGGIRWKKCTVRIIALIKRD